MQFHSIAIWASLGSGKNSTRQKLLHKGYVYIFIQCLLISTAEWTDTMSHISTCMTESREFLKIQNNSKKIQNCVLIVEWEADFMMNMLSMLLSVDMSMIEMHPTITYRKHSASSIRNMTENHTLTHAWKKVQSKLHRLIANQ